MFASRTAWNLDKNRFTLALEKQKRAGKPVLDLTVSNPTDCNFLFSAEEILGPLTAPAALKYQPEAQGLLVARQTIANYYADKSIDVSPQNIILTTSTSEGYSFIFRLLCESGDEVLVPRPSYPLFQFLADIQDVRLVPYSLVYDHGWQLDLNSLHSAITRRTKAVIVVNPNNPTGSYVKPSEIQELNRLCQHHQLAIISDEVFQDYPLAASVATSFASNKEVLTFTLSGLSKIAGLPQMKVAWVAVSGTEELRAQSLARFDVISDTFLSMNAPIQHALPALLASRHSFQKQLNSRLCSNLKTLDTKLSAQSHCTRLGVEAGWYAIVRVPVTQTDEDLAIILLEKQNVLVHPGHFFDFEQEGYLIISLMTPEEIFSEGIQRILNAVANPNH